MFTTSRLLACGIAAGPVYFATGLLQAVTRDGFDLTRHPFSLLSNGSLGWIQIANFLVTGLLVLVSAVGIRRAVPTGRGRTWGPILIGAFGIGMIAAGLFPADPMNGFPAGTPDGPPVTATWHGALHFVAGGIGFTGLIAGCFVFARRFAGLGQRGWALYSLVTGVLFTVAYAGIASGSTSAIVAIGFTIAVALGLLWLATVTNRLRAENS